MAGTVLSRIRSAVVVVLVPWLAVVAMPLRAQEGLHLEEVEFHGLIESETALGVKRGELQKWDLIFKPELVLSFSGDLRVTARGRIRLDPVDRLEPGRMRGQRAFRSILSRRLLLGRVTDVELREFYLDAQFGGILLRLGKQQIVWGQADGLRVLDIVDPFDFREFILPQFEDRRIPLWTANIEIPVGTGTLQLLWIPDHTYDEIPAAGAVFAFTSPLVVPQPDPLFIGTAGLVVVPPRRPTRFIRDDDYGMRWSAFLGGWDLSLNYLYHYQDQAVAFQRRVETGALAILPQYRRTHLIGGTFSNAFGSFTLRGEVGYSTRRFFLSRDPIDADGVVPSGELGYVLGIDYQADADLRLSGQLFQSVLTRRTLATVRRRLESRATFLVEKDFMNDRLTARVLMIRSLNDGDGLTQAQLAYEYRSQVTLRFGLDFFDGTRKGLFGEFRDANRVTFGIEFGF